MLVFREVLLLIDFKFPAKKRKQKNIAAEIGKTVCRIGNY
jgi:hypothetical protein